MILATIQNGSADGALVVLSGDRMRFLPADGAAPNLLSAMERWGSVAPGLASLSDRLTTGEGHSIADLQFRAPLPRSWQWLDGSAF